MKMVRKNKILIILIFISVFFLLTKDVRAQNIQVALTSNVAPWQDQHQGTLYHLNILKTFLPIDITAVNDFSNINNYNFLIVDRMRISNADITTITNWVNNGGKLIWIGQSGRYDENGVERASHPMASVLGINFNSWSRSGADLRYIYWQNDWLWWKANDVVDWRTSYYLPASETVNIGVSTATNLANIRDSNNANPTPGFTRNNFGSGRAYFYANDFFWNSGYKEMARDGSPAFFFDHANWLWSSIFGIIVENTNDPLPVLASMPNGAYTVMMYQVHAEGGRGSLAGDRTVGDDNLYRDLTQVLAPNLYDYFPSLKGWFWTFFTAIALIDGTDNETNIINFINEYGKIGVHSYSHGSFSFDSCMGAYAACQYSKGLDVVNTKGFNYKFAMEGVHDSIANTQPLMNKNASPFVVQHLNISGSGDSTTYQRLPDIPLPVINITNPDIIKYWASGDPADWMNEGIEGQSVLGAQYGIGGVTEAIEHTWESRYQWWRPIIEKYINNATVWKANHLMLADWLERRWNTRITNYAVTPDSISFNIQTSGIDGLTMLLRPLAQNINSVLVDGNLATLQPNNHVVFPNLAAGTHNVVVYLTSQPICIRANPIVTIFPTTQSGLAGSTLNYTVSVRNNDNSICGSSPFSLTAQIPSGWSYSFDSSSLTINPGSTISTTLRVTSSSTAVNGDYTIDITARNDIDNRYNFTTSIIYQVTMTISGTLTDANNRPVSANINFGSQNVSTDSTGYYTINLLPGIYDLIYTIRNLFISDYWIKTPSVNISSNVYNKLMHVTNYTAQQRQHLSLIFDVSGDQTIQSYSPDEPLNVYQNGAALTPYTTLESLNYNYGWYYDSGNKILYVKFNETNLQTSGLSIEDELRDDGNLIWITKIQFPTQSFGWMLDIQDFGSGPQFTSITRIDDETVRITGRNFGASSDSIEVVSKPRQGYRKITIGNNFTPNNFMPGVMPGDILEHWEEVPTHRDIGDLPEMGWYNLYFFNSYGQAILRRGGFNYIGYGTYLKYTAPYLRDPSPGFYAQIGWVSNNEFVLFVNEATNSSHSYIQWRNGQKEKVYVDVQTSDCMSFVYTFATPRGNVRIDFIVDRYIVGTPCAYGDAFGTSNSNIGGSGLAEATVARR